MEKIDASIVPSPEDAINSEKSRYRDVPKLIDSIRGITTLGLYKQSKEVYNNITSFSYYEITARSAFRPDLISYVAYNDPSYWWVILEINNISGIEELYAGRTLKIPSLGQFDIYRETMSDNDIFA